MRAEALAMLLLSGGAGAAAPTPESPDPKLLEFIGQWSGTDEAWWLDTAVEHSESEGNRAPTDEDQSNE